MTTINTSSFTGVILGPGGHSFGSLSISGDGRYVALLDQASSTVVFARDILLGAGFGLSFGPSGPPNGNATSADISDDFHFAVFASPASNLILSDTNGSSDIFLRDVWMGTTIRLSEVAGVGGNGNSTGAHISADGRFVTYLSLATNLAAGDDNGAQDLFRRDLLTGETTIISRSSSGALADSSSLDSAMSSDGRFVVFTSDATNLVDGDVNGKTDVFLCDTWTDTTRLASAASDAGASATGIGVSDDGRYVLFQSEASSVVDGDTNGEMDIFRRDMDTGVIERVSVTTAGTESPLGAYKASMSADGRFVVFESLSSYFVDGDTNGVSDIFLRDTLTGTTMRLSVGLGGAEANGASYGAVISADGNYVSFVTDATNLYGNDTDGASDVLRISLTASSTADYLIGSNGADSMIGLGGGDVLNGGPGDDTLDGGTGADLMTGGGGADLYAVDSAGDTVDEATAPTNDIDTVMSGITFSLSDARHVKGAVENLALTGSAISGVGNDLANVLTGNGTANILSGGIGNDTLDGGLGKDTMTGGDDSDTFRFTTKLGSTNIDTIIGFSHPGDRIELDNAIFTKVTSVSSSSFFYAASGASKAHDANDRIIYDTKTHKLYYDDDGNKAHGHAAVQFAVLDHPVGALSWNDFAII